ncbi:unnamed protein product [Lactuca virosa]|uniref:Aminotransferase-like plant mobile domain-containing protein n=1 Tax=Lactuca virosa TaxID=75947 RepID=A0AAU9MKJ4_9ASTR|nr:unnamed protein product [Lactuca virosa]
MDTKEDGQTSQAKSSHKASKSQATGPSTVADTSLPQIYMDVSNYITLLETQEQPKEVGVIVKYLQKCPLAYALTATSQILDSLISEVFQSSNITPRASSKELNVEFDLGQTTLVLNKEEFATCLGLNNGYREPSTFVTPSSAQLVIIFKEMGYKFEEKVEPNLSRNNKARLPMQWHFLSSVLTQCLFGSVGGRSLGSTNLWIVMYGLYYDINVDYMSILSEDLLTFLPASKNKFEIPEGPLPLFLHMSPYQIRTTSEYEFIHPIIIPDVILAKLGENSASLRSYQKYIKGITSSPKKKRKHSDHASKKLAKKKKAMKSDLEGPRNRVSLVCYDSIDDNDQEGEKQSELEDLTQSTPVQHNQDDDTPIQTVDIPSSEGLIVDNEPNDMSIVLYSKTYTMTFNIDLDDYSPSTQKESQENDDPQEEKFFSFPPNPPQEDCTPANKDEANVGFYVL